MGGQDTCAVELFPARAVFGAKGQDHRKQYPYEREPVDEHEVKGIFELPDAEGGLVPDTEAFFIFKNLLDKKARPEKPQRTLVTVYFDLPGWIHAIEDRYPNRNLAVAEELMKEITSVRVRQEIWEENGRESKPKFTWMVKLRHSSKNKELKNRLESDNDQVYDTEAAAIRALAAELRECLDLGNTLSIPIPVDYYYEKIRWSYSMGGDCKKTGIDLDQITSLNGIQLEDPLLFVEFERSDDDDKKIASCARSLGFEGPLRPLSTKDVFIEKGFLPPREG